MAAVVAVVAVGRGVELYNRVKSNDPTNAAFIVVLLKAAETNAVLQDYDTLQALLNAAGNTEADFTNYTRKTLTDTELAALPAPDDTNNRRDLDLPDITWAGAGGAVNNNLVKLLICYDADTTAGTDANVIPVSIHDFVGSTNGGDITAQIAAAGFYRAAAV